MPEMVGNIVGVYNGKVFNPVEVKFDMIGRYLGEFSLSYKPTRHGKAGVGATKGSAHTSLKWYVYCSYIFHPIAPFLNKIAILPKATFNTSFRYIFSWFSGSLIKLTKYILKLKGQSEGIKVKKDRIEYLIFIKNKNAQVYQEPISSSTIQSKHRFWISSRKERLKVA